VRKEEQKERKRKSDDMGKITFGKITIALIPVIIFFVGVYTFFTVQVGIPSEDLPADVPVIIAFPFFVIISIMFVSLLIILFYKRRQYKNEKL